MTDPQDRPRIYINWKAIRPNSPRGWLAAIGFFAIAILVLVLITAIASTLLMIALVVAAVSAVWWFVAGFFGRRSRDVVPYRSNDYDA